MWILRSVILVWYSDMSLDCQVFLPCHRSSQARFCSSPRVHGCSRLAYHAHFQGVEAEQSDKCRDDNSRHFMWVSKKNHMKTGVFLKVSKLTAGNKRKRKKKRIDGNETGTKGDLFLRSHLAGIDRDGNEGCLRQELGGSQQVPHSLYISLILLHRLHPHLFFGEKGFITRCIASRG